jgi:PAS domain S-box-containing protein
VLDVSGLDRLISIYPSIEAAAAGRPRPVADVTPGKRSTGDGQRDIRRLVAPAASGVTAALLWGLINALADGVALTDADGVLVLVNRRLEEMLGYRRGELAGRPVEELLPGDLLSAHIAFRAGYERRPHTRAMGVGARLVALRKDGATVPVQVSLTPFPTATSQFTLAVVRDVSAEQRIAAALERLDDVIHEIRDYAFTVSGTTYPPHPAPIDDA